MRSVEQINDDIKALDERKHLVQADLSVMQRQAEARLTEIGQSFALEARMIAQLQAKVVGREGRLAPLAVQVDNLLAKLGYHEIDEPRVAVAPDANAQSMAVPLSAVVNAHDKTSDNAVVHLDAGSLAQLQNTDGLQIFLSELTASLQNTSMYLRENGGAFPSFTVVRRRSRPVESADAVTKPSHLHLNGSVPGRPGNGNRSQRQVESSRDDIITIFFSLESAAKELTALEHLETSYAMALLNFKTVLSYIQQVELLHGLTCAASEYSPYKNVINNFSRMNSPSHQKDIFDGTYTFLTDKIKHVSQSINAAGDISYSHDQLGHDLSQIIMYTHLFEDLLQRMDKAYQSPRQLLEMMAVEEKFEFDPSSHQQELISNSVGEKELQHFSKMLSSYNDALALLCLSLETTETTPETIIEVWRDTHNLESQLVSSLHIVQGYFARQKIPMGLGGIAVNGLKPFQTREQILPSTESVQDQKTETVSHLTTAGKLIVAVGAQIWKFEAILQGRPVKGTFKSTFGSAQLTLGLAYGYLNGVEKKLHKEAVASR